MSKVEELPLVISFLWGIQNSAQKWRISAAPERFFLWEPVAPMGEFDTAFGPHYKLRMENLSPTELNRSKDDINDGYYRPHPQPTDEVIARTRGIVDGPARRENARNLAERDKRTEFIAPCYRHGDHSLFDTLTGACLLCLSANASLPPQARYKAAMATRYVDSCQEHGEATYRFGTSGCALCGESRGRPEVKDTTRAAARHEGQLTYLAACSQHGETPHGVNTGKCLSCFTTMGAPRGVRPRGRPSSNPERAGARASGSTTYQAVCDEHGIAAHHTIRGKCLRCFNSLGAPRRRT